MDEDPDRLSADHPRQVRRAPAVAHSSQVRSCRAWAPVCHRRARLVPRTPRPVPKGSTADDAYRVVRAIINTAVTDGPIAKSPCTVKGAGSTAAAERPVASVAELTAAIEAVPEQSPLWHGQRASTSTDSRAIDEPDPPRPGRLRDGRCEVRATKADAERWRACQLVRRPPGPRLIAPERRGGTASDGGPWAPPKKAAAPVAPSGEVPDARRVALRRHRERYELLETGNCGMSDTVRRHLGDARRPALGHAARAQPARAGSRRRWARALAGQVFWPREGNIA